jgi:hypothetical protein
MPNRSPIIASLVIAANLCASTVAGYWATSDSPSLNAEVVYFALLSGQLSALCLWSALRLRSKMWSFAVPLLAALLAALAYTVRETDRLTDFLAFFAAQAATITLAMWVFQRTRYWQQRSGTKTDWQFSIAQLLIAMTVVALLIVAFQSSTLWNDQGGDDTRQFFGFLGISSILAVASTYIWSLASHWLLRLAGVLALAIAVSTIHLLDNRFMFAFFAVTFLIEGIVLSIALTLGGILPSHEANHTPA